MDDFSALDGSPVVYVLALEQEKYYVGYSEHISKRIRQHMTGSGCAWTSNYKPIRVVDVSRGTTADEVRRTKELMMTHGINNVRGGPWCSMELTDATRDFLMLEFNATHDLCYSCGKAGHKARTCEGSSEFPSSLWTTLDKGYGDTVHDDNGELHVSFSGQRDGANDTLVKVGSLFSYRSSSSDEWTIGGRVKSVEVLKVTVPRRFLLTIAPLPSSGTRLRGKAAVCRTVSVPIPKRDKWEMSGIIAH